MRHSLSAPAAAEGPILALNTTPLIDVMLVLLIMFIVTIPAATHKLPLALPSGPPPPAPPPAVHRIGIGASGALSWGGIAPALLYKPVRHPDVYRAAAGS